MPLLGGFTVCPDPAIQTRLLVTKILVNKYTSITTLHMVGLRIDILHDSLLTSMLWLQAISEISENKYKHILCETKHKRLDKIRCVIGSITFEAIT